MNALDKLIHDIELANKKYNKTKALNMNTPTTSEVSLKDIYFKFYDEYLDPSDAKKAKINYYNDVNGATNYIPKNIEEALSYGFIFEDAPEGHDYWQALAEKFESQQEEEEAPTETETHGPLKDVYFKFYDEQLEPSDAEKAKRNLNNDARVTHRSYIPKNFEEALSYGFIFKDTPEGHGYWQYIAEKAERQRQRQQQQDEEDVPSNPSVLPDSGDRSEFTTGAVRDASYGKGNPSLIPIDALRAVSKRFEDGATKYGRDNWKKGIPLSRYVDSLYRHLWQLMEGDTTEDHAGAIIWNAMCLTQTKKWIEDGKLPKELNDL